MAYLGGVSLPGSARAQLTPFKPALQRAPTQLIKPSMSLSSSRYQTSTDGRAESDRRAAILAALPKSQGQIDRERRKKIYVDALNSGAGYQQAQAIVTAQTGKPYSAF